MLWAANWRTSALLIENLLQQSQSVSLQDLPGLTRSNSRKVGWFSTIESGGGGAAAAAAPAAAPAVMVAVVVMMVVVVLVLVLVVVVTIVAA